MGIKTIGGKINFAVVGISLGALVTASMILFTELNHTKKEIYAKITNDLHLSTEVAFASKKAVGISNAVGIANDGQIKQALKTNNRQFALDSLKTLATSYKQNTTFKNIKVHVHTTNNHSFIRAWKPKKFGDDLSGFRASIVSVNKNQQPITTFEVGKAGLSLRAVTPVFGANHKHIGSLEFMQGLNSVAKAFKKEGSAFLLLMNESVKIKPIKTSKQFKNYGISQKFIDKAFLKEAKTLNMSELFSNGYAIKDKYFYTYINVKDFQGKKLGIALVGKPLSTVNQILDSATTIIYSSLTIILFIAIITILSLIIIIKKVVTKPLEEFEEGLSSFFKYINKEQSDIKILENNCNDEIGNMTRVVNDNISKTKALIDQDDELIEEAKIVMGRVANGWYSQTISKETNNQSLNNFKDSVNHMIKATKTSFLKINERLNEYANYNYMTELNMPNIEKGGVFDLLIRDINVLKTSITQMLIENKSNGLTLGESSQLLLKNVNILNTNSTQSATALEQTAAALEEITSNISSNTNNIIKMSVFAESLAKSSNEGKELASQTTQAMNEIDQEVNAINDAISVIDQISFQTNILSLNAAVEAATAGESGKGFAVVAQEVRNLASRSADAANEIKAIVQKATDKANYGKSISVTMINGYEELNKNVTETRNLISDIENASKEQLQGIEQINDAVAELDQQTQQNASIASATYDIAVQTDTIAKLVVSNVNEKEFIGKDTVKTK